MSIKIKSTVLRKHKKRQRFCFVWVMCGSWIWLSSNMTQRHCILFIFTFWWSSITILKWLFASMFGSLRCSAFCLISDIRHPSSTRCFLSSLSVFVNNILGNSKTLQDFVEMVVESIQFAMSFISNKILYFLWWFVSLQQRFSNLSILRTPKWFIYFLLTHEYCKQRINNTLLATHEQNARVF